MSERTERAQLERIEGWREGLEGLNAPLAPRFARPEVRSRVGRYLFGLLGEAERKKNGFYEKAKFVNAEVAAVSVLQEP